jgi:hypothetical protein
VIEKKSGPVTKKKGIKPRKLKLNYTYFIGIGTIEMVEK